MLATSLAIVTVRPAHRLPVRAHPLFGPPAAVGMLAYLRYRKIGADSNASGGYVYDKSSAKQSPAPAPRRTASGGSIDLEGACTPRFRQPITPRRSALKHGAASGAFSVSTGAGGGAFHVHAVQAGVTAQRAGPQLVPGVHLLPRAPSSTAGSGAVSLAGSAGPRVPASVARSMAAIQDLQVGSVGCLLVLWSGRGVGWLRCLDRLAGHMWAGMWGWLGSVVPVFFSNHQQLGVLMGGPEMQGLQHAGWYSEEAGLWLWRPPFTWDAPTTDGNLPPAWEQPCMPTHHPHKENCSRPFLPFHAGAGCSAGGIPGAAGSRAGSDAGVPEKQTPAGHLGGRGLPHCSPGGRAAGQVAEQAGEAWAPGAPSPLPRGGGQQQQRRTLPCQPARQLHHWA